MVDNSFRFNSSAVLRDEQIAARARRLLERTVDRRALLRAGGTATLASAFGAGAFGHVGPVAAASTAPTSAPSGDGMITVDVVYDRAAALQAADRHWRDPYVFENDCAVYVSKCLWGGGLPRTDSWTDSSTDASVQADTFEQILNQPGWTVNAVRADALVTYLVNQQWARKRFIDWSDNTASGAQVGDVIAYAWYDPDTIDHVSFITELNDEGYPFVAQHNPSQWGRYWSYSDESDRWLVDVYSDPVAYLVQINPITVPSF